MGAIYLLHPIKIVKYLENCGYKSVDRISESVIFLSQSTLNFVAEVAPGKEVPMLARS